MYGGGQEQGLRPGTENPALAAAFAAALEEVQNPKAREEFIARAVGAREKLLNTLESAFPSRTTIHPEHPAFLLNAGKEFAPHILNISFPGIDTDYAVMLLSEAGFAVSTKSACETNEEVSRVISVLFDEHTQEPSNQESSRATSTLRISWGPTTTARELQAFAKELLSTIYFLNAPDSTRA
jgi:cysteine desulfurase